MDSISLHFTYFAPSFGASPCFGLRCPPSTSPCVSPASCPSRMVFLADVFGLPLSHTPITAKCLFRMEITGGADHIISAIITLFCKFILWLAMLIASLMIAIQRTIDFIETHKGRKDLLAGRTFLFNCVIFVLKPWHDYLVSFSISNVKKNNIGIEIEEKYCEIAVRRLQQEVLPL